MPCFPRFQVNDIIGISHEAKIALLHFLSNSSRTTLDTNGLSGPPCGAPSIDAWTRPPSIDPTCKYVRMSFNTVLSATRSASLPLNGHDGCGRRISLCRYLTQCDDPLACNCAFSLPRHTLAFEGEIHSFAQRMWGQIQVFVNTCVITC